jgi:hypothetical protein
MELSKRMELEEEGWPRKEIRLIVVPQEFAPSGSLTRFCRLLSDDGSVAMMMDTIRIEMRVTATTQYCVSRAPCECSGPTCAISSPNG